MHDKHFKVDVLRLGLNQPFGFEGPLPESWSRLKGLGYVDVSLNGLTGMLCILLSRPLCGDEMTEYISTCGTSVMFKIYKS